MPVWAVRFSVLVADHKRNLQDIKRWVQMLAADNADEFSVKAKQYLDDPVDALLSLIERGKRDNDISAIRRADLIINNWLAVDIYPEHRMERVETIMFLKELVAGYDEFPF